MKACGYYPGCSLAGGGVELDLSIREVSKAAGVDLREIEDWNCCGATAAHCLNHDLAVALPYRVLSLAEEQGLAEVLAPCAACFSRLKGTNLRLARSAELAGRVRAVVGRPYGGGVKIVNVNEFCGRLAAGGLKDKLSKPLGLKVAGYYGCLLSRGEGIVEGEDPENPSAMDAVIRAAGCEPVSWNFSTECCGGGFSMSKTEAVVELSAAVLADARAAGADLVVTGCPMCHSNLDMRQRSMGSEGRGMPVLYLSELLGLACGLKPEALGLNRHFTDAGPIASPLSVRGERRPSECGASRNTSTPGGR
ncbi:MAG: CoB--CoM heterodisulfide reductase iron-sulfur subunit B family protein [Elusimicrobia bacterium]|nr:CoB--CoM heterodisulfide reductase iron-sulfur subunit B family protein [Elusimicrobiota bacterium]